MSIGPSKETIMFEACLDRRLANTFVSFGASLLPSGGSFSSLPGGAIMPSTDRMKPTLIAGSRSLLGITIYSGLGTLCRARHNVPLLVEGRHCDFTSTVGIETFVNLTLFESHLISSPSSGSLPLTCQVRAKRGWALTARANA